MNHSSSQQGGSRKIGSRRRKEVSISAQSLVTSTLLEPGQSLPLVIQPAVDELNAIAWAESNRTLIETQLLQHGGILFRHFDITSVTQFERFITAVSGELLEYRERSSPRSQVEGKIYTSTDYPADQSIFLHNENSYQSTFPLKIFFYCNIAPEQGGETPIADCRAIFQRIRPEVKERFIQKKVMYVRNFSERLGLPWSDVFQTNDKAQVEAYCRAAGIDFEWKSDYQLRICQIRPATIRHPKTNEMIWFNHATFFHISTLPAVVREVLLNQFGEEDLPSNSFYGDGSVIEADVLDELREIYRQEKVLFRWQKGDILMLDNILVAHGREPFVGERSIAVGMTELFNRQDI
jgi:alpha-ketoglutarate-dependent taurine dioxygenase